MDAGKTWSNPSPREKANILSVLMFTWTFKTFWRGYKKDLEAEDLYNPLPEHKSDYLGDKLAKNWEKEIAKFKCKKGTPSFMKAIFATFGPQYMLFGLIFACMELTVRIGQPLFLGKLISYFNPGSEISKESAYWHAGGVVLCSGIAIYVSHPYMISAMHIGMKVRVACCSLIYRKALRLSKTALGQTTAGQVVNLLSNDVNRFDIVFMFLHYLWIGPIETAIITYLLYTEIGISAILGIAALLTIIPIQGYLGKMTSSIRLKTAMRTDERVRLMNEIIAGIQVIKMYTWEKPFAKLVAMARRNEIKEIRKSSYIRGFFLSFLMFTTRAAVFFTVLAYSLLGNLVVAEKVFVMTSYYNILRQTMTVFFPQGIGQLAETLVSVGRLQKFLLYEENVLEPLPSELATKTNDIKINDVTAKWTSNVSENTLNNITLDVKPGMLVAIIGPVGAGKSSLLHAILHELPLSSGSIQVGGSVSYASQEPWMFAGSVRKNILFGEPYDKVRYNQVVRVCALKRDFEELPHGDQTIVGERGVSLSGGQRARVNLARAVYKSADIYLLDDPLSAVDTHVGKHLFEDCVSSHLSSKTRILVTHQLQYLKPADLIVVMDNGAIVAQGTFDELQSSGLDFVKLLSSEEDDEDNVENDKISIGSRHSSVQSLRSRSESVEAEQAEEQQMVDEIRSKGSVGSTVYRKYFASGGNYCTITFMFSLFLLSQLVSSGCDYWVTFWTNMEELRHLANPHVVDGATSSFSLSMENYTVEENSTYTTEIPDLEGNHLYDIFTTDICIYVYSALVLGCIVISLTRSVAFFYVCMRASTRLHDRMFSAITRATMRFFNTNPSGRILNRFSKDVGAVDELLPLAMMDAMQIGLALAGIVVVVAIVNYWLLVPTAVIGVIFFFFRIIYVATSRNVKRLEGITRSPVFSHLNASLQGLTTIRAFKAQELLIQQFDNHQDLHSSTWFMFINTSRAFGFWLDFICFIYIGVVTFSFLVIGGEKFGGNVGLAITQSIGLTGMFQWGMRQSAEMENQMTSVERILEFTNVESEPALESPPEKKPPSNWPSKGEVIFDKLFLKYNPDDPPVLKNLCLVFQPKEKVGIVGRTGAGKSSLISALFRLTDLEGSVRIDGWETTSMGLHDLRSKISIIPQEPVIFSGIMRKNLDPFDDFPDYILWQALEEVELKEAVEDMAGGLNARMSEGGTNFSVGQRQLVCLARAIIRNNKILILDEATANVDPQMDAIIQTTIRKKFADCTVLTIAHRLHTIMDSDRVLVMDAGRAVEFDHPHILLKNKDGFLYKMVQQTGKTMADTLHKIAEADYNKKNMPPR
ncbi:ATP-binding cassette sub-family C member 4-like [Ischnura elegans]|uniref:ATP-binding cassette sub-family C member 4-like n=1 Tax=Ischnura elegans TaxID=197161 RepID=UPI001ED8A3F6|nr:ATP-binding cassette sub-family C member 4-like [Ischnura elegans]XP_046392417.1 ATP-binding cassette sub-family C member 4-like [Ischnura elegans]